MIDIDDYAKKTRKLVELHKKLYDELERQLVEMVETEPTPKKVQMIYELHKIIEGINLWINRP